MCNSNVHQGAALIEVIATISHNLSTIVDDLDILRATRVLGGRQVQILEEAREKSIRARDVLYMALDELPKVDR